MLLQLPQILFFLRKRHPVFARRGFRINLMALHLCTRIFTHTQPEKFTLYLIAEYIIVKIRDDQLCTII